MIWYEGSIADAVNLSKQRNTIFVVFVEDDHILSRDLTKTIEHSLIQKRLSDTNNFLAVKLKSGSENYTYFAQIYQFVPVPSLFFIGRNGIPLEVVCAGVEIQSLALRIDRLLQEHRKFDTEGQIAKPSTSSQEVRVDTQSEAGAQSEKPPHSDATNNDDEKGKDVECSEANALRQANEELLVREPSRQNQPNGPLSQQAPIYQVKPNLQEEPNYEAGLICQRGTNCQVPKAVPEDQAESKVQAVPIDQAGPKDQAQTMDQTGPSQSPSSSKVLQEPVPATESITSIEQKMEKAKELIEIRRREKEAKEKEEAKQKEKERRAAGQGVAELKKWQADQELKQIQEERKREKMENNLARQRILEQIAQDRAERRARDQPPAPSAPPAQPAAPVAPPAGAGEGGARARVQFKLPAGDTHTAHFPAAAPLAHLTSYVADNLHLPAGSFSLWTAFPRRELAPPSATLQELRLAPSAALLVLPRAPPPPARAATRAPLAALTAFITQLFTSFVLDPSYQIFSWLRNRIFPTPTIPPTPTTPATPTTPPNPPPPTQGLRRRGNIHRLPGDTSGDDDNNTWNGNSTQQM